jgi:hypothetical protein
MATRADGWHGAGWMMHAAASVGVVVHAVRSGQAEGYRG